jgi:hypothetical protein
MARATADQVFETLDVNARLTGELAAVASNEPMPGLQLPWLPLSDSRTVASSILCHDGRPRCLN